jgi:hypothetical protein
MGAAQDHGPLRIPSLPLSEDIPHFIDGDFQAELPQPMDEPVPSLPVFFG